MTNEQMELGLGGVKIKIHSSRRERRITRASWWFDQMRDIVDRAMEPVANPRPEQTWLPGTHRQVRI